MLEFRLTLVTACIVALILTTVNISSLSGVLQHHYAHHHHEHIAHEIRIKPGDVQAKTFHTEAERVVEATAVATTTSATDTGSSSSVEPGDAKELKTANCPQAFTHTEYWGDVVKWGATNKVNTWEECCRQCQEHIAPNPDDPECNVWVYCADKSSCGDQYQECWLKHLSHPDATRPRAQGPHIPWVSGMRLLSTEQQHADIVKHRAEQSQSEDDKRYHFVLSAQGFVTHWQTRVHYYWYKKQKKMCEEHPPCHMGGFTRILHSGEPDDLMDEIPTIVVDPLPAEKNKGYVVLNRPYAFIQWLKVQNIREKNIIMVEPDHIMLRPIPNLMKNGLPAAFPFFYIEPAKKEFAKVTRKFVGNVPFKELEKIAPIGNSPTFIRLDDFKSMVDLWYNVTVAIFEDKEANKAWGWVLEMYGFTIAEYLAKIGPVSLHLNLMAQPPWDTKIDNFYILHYTYGQDFDEKGKFTPGKVGYWHWDKRDHMAKAISRNIPLPPDGCTNEATITLIKSMNEASANIECWDEYATSRRVHRKDGTGRCVPVPKPDHSYRSSMDKFPNNF